MHCPLSGFALTQQFVLILFLGWWWICGLWKQNGEDSGGNTQSPALMVHCMCKENVYSQGNYWYIDHVDCYNSMCENHLFVNEIHLEGVYMLISWSEPIIFSTARHEENCFGKDSVSTVVDKLWKRIEIIYFFIWILSFNYCGPSCSPNLFACRSDEHVASPNNFHTFSSRQIMRILNLMKKKLSWSNTKFLLLIYKKMCGSYRGDIGSLMLATYTVALIRSFFQCCPCQ